MNCEKRIAGFLLDEVLIWQYSTRWPARYSNRYWFAMSRSHTAGAARSRASSHPGRTIQLRSMSPVSIGKRPVASSEIVRRSPAFSTTSFVCFISGEMPVACSTSGIESRKGVYARTPISLSRLDQRSHASDRRVDGQPTDLDHSRADQVGVRRVGGANDEAFGEPVEGDGQGMERDQRVAPWSHVRVPVADEGRELLQLDDDLMSGERRKPRVDGCERAVELRAGHVVKEIRVARWHLGAQHGEILTPATDVTRVERLCRAADGAE